MNTDKFPGWPHFESVGTAWKSFTPQDGVRQIDTTKKDSELIERFKKICAGNKDKGAVDLVNQPPHYASDKIECIDVIDQLVKSIPGDQAFYVANVLKYVWRYPKKGGVQDLKKAQFYLKRLIEKLDK